MHITPTCIMHVKGVQKCWELNNNVESADRED